MLVHHSQLTNRAQAQMRNCAKVRLLILNFSANKMRHCCPTLQVRLGSAK
jgi:hypothetical protein